MRKGKVYIVGAGPGDPDLLTIKALKAIEEADVILYDKLVGDEIISMLRKTNKTLVFAGKRCGENGSVRQNEINMLMKKYAEEGKIVVRLKGGDPFVFGRGGIEAEFLAKEGIPFEVIPGVSSINSVPAYAGIPLTHPTLSSSVLVVTGRDDIEAWKRTPLNGTIVILMGRDTIGDVCEKLIEAGRDPSTPVAVIENGTTKQQRVLIADLSSIAEVVEREKVSGPALIVVGEVVRMAEVIGRQQ